MIGEAAGEPEEGKAAVAHVVQNRLKSGRFGPDLPSVLFAPKQFEPWHTRARELMGYTPDSPAYQKAARVVDGVLNGDIDDPTGGATHFANVKTVQDRGNTSALGWINGMSNVSRIGNHTFGNAGAGSGGRRYTAPPGLDTAEAGGGTDGSTGTRRRNSSPDGEPFSFDALARSLAEETNDPRRLAVRELIHELLADVTPPDGQGHAVALGGADGGQAGLGLLDALTGSEADPASTSGSPA